MVIQSKQQANHNEANSSDESFSVILLRQNPLLVQLIGLSPLLAVSYSLVNSLATGLIFSVVFLITSILVSISRRLIPAEISVPCYVIITTTIVTSIDFILQAWRPELREVLWIYLPIIAANCLIIDRLQVFAAQNPLIRTIPHVLFNCLAVLLVLMILGASRELIGTGALFQDAHLLFGLDETAIIQAESIVTDNVTSPITFSLATLPAGAFIFLGLLIALKQLIFQPDNP